MKVTAKTTLFFIVSILILCISYLSSPYLSAAICTIWIIFIIINYGLWGGLVFTILMGIYTAVNYVLATDQNITFLIMGLVTYLCMSVGIGIPIDMSRKEHEKRIESERQLRTITDNMQDVILQIDSSGVIRYISPSCFGSLGYSPDYFIGKSFYDGIHPEDYEAVAKMINNARDTKRCNRMEYRYRDSNGSYVWMESVGEIIPDNQSHSIEIVISCRDITERKESEERVQYLLFHDTLTGLYNRTYFEEEQKRLNNNRVFPLSIIIGDVNSLKFTNDVFGHSQGDQLLCKAALIFRECCNMDAVIARWGGDEYAVLLPGLDEEGTSKVVRSIEQRCNSDRSELAKLSISLGSATRNTDDDDINDLFKEAEERMYRNKLLQSRNVRNSIIASLEKTLFERSYETREHAERMMHLAHRLGEMINLSEKEQDELRLLSLLHDIGTIAIKDSIISKPGKLTEFEWEEMKKHTEVGYRIAISTPELCHIADFILSHHERWDGGGYPQGLKGNMIPQLSRVLTIIDAYDAMTHDRTYQAAISHNEAINEVERCSGTQFDPELASIFINMMKETK